MRTTNNHIIGKNEDYWLFVLGASEERIFRLLKDNNLTLSDILKDRVEFIDDTECDHKSGDCRCHMMIENKCEAEEILAYIIDHASCAKEKALGITAITEWIQAYNEIIKTDFEVSH